MPITQVEKIWMDGELVDWSDAKIHVLSHALHYGTGVFEGIRAYETARGPAVWHMSAMDRAAILHAIADGVDARVPELAAVETRDNGS